MSWLARSVVGSLMPPSNPGDHAGNDDTNKEEDQHPIEPETPKWSVGNDLSEITKTLTRQLRGVASFLAPPPQSSSFSSPAATDEHPPPASESPRLSGIRSDFAELGGRFRSGLSMLSNSRAVSEISKMASTFISFELEEFDEETGAVGVTDEVVAFVRDLSMHPETWLDFPVLPHEEGSDDFDMSDEQQEHAVAVERLAPRLAAVRKELCPKYMSEGCFWMIYFVLLHPRLDKHDAQLLSTSQIVRARAMLLKELQSQPKQASEPETMGETSCVEEVLTPVPHQEDDMMSDIVQEVTPPEMLTFQVPETSRDVMHTETIEKIVVEEDRTMLAKDRDFSNNTWKTLIQSREDGDEWLEEDTGEMQSSRVTIIPVVNEEDVSFSDFEEEDDDQSAGMGSKFSSTDLKEDDSGGWVQL